MLIWFLPAGHMQHDTNADMCCVHFKLWIPAVFAWSLHTEQQSCMHRMQSVREWTVRQQRMHAQCEHGLFAVCHIQSMWQRDIFEWCLHNKLDAKLPELPDECVVFVWIVSERSLHQHNQHGMFELQCVQRGTV